MPQFNLNYVQVLLIFMTGVVVGFVLSVVAIVKAKR